MIFLLILLFLANPSGGGGVENACSNDLSLKNRNYDETIRLCTKAIDSSKLSGADLSAAYKNRGKSWEGKKEYDQAIADYNKSLEIDPNDAGTYFARGSAWFDKAEYDHYLEDYNKAMDLSHNDPRSNPTL